jgi:hypothetical protein
MILDTGSCGNSFILVIIGPLYSYIIRNLNVTHFFRNGSSYSKFLCSTRYRSVFVFKVNLIYALSGVRVPAEAGNFSLHHRVQTGSGAHPVSCPMGNWGSLPWAKATGA